MNKRSKKISQFDPKAQPSKLDQEFEKVEKQIQAKLKQAADLIVDARMLMQDREMRTSRARLMELYEFDYDPIENNAPLKAALKQGGWRVSTMICD